MSQKHVSIQAPEDIIGHDASDTNGAPGASAAAAASSGAAAASVSTPRSTAINSTEEAIAKIQASDERKKAKKRTMLYAGTKSLLASDLKLRTTQGGDDILRANVLPVEDRPSGGAGSLSNSDYVKVPDTIVIRAIPYGQINFGLFIVFIGVIFLALPLNNDEIVGDGKPSKSFWWIVVLGTLVIVLGMAISLVAEVDQVVLDIKKRTIRISKWSLYTCGLRPPKHVRYEQMSNIEGIHILTLDTADKSGRYHMIQFTVYSGDPVFTLESSSKNLAHARKLRLIKWFKIAGRKLAQAASSRSLATTASKDSTPRDMTHSQRELHSIGEQVSVNFE